MEDVLEERAGVGIIWLEEGGWVGELGHGEQGLSGHVRVERQSTGTLFQNLLKLHQSVTIDDMLSEHVLRHATQDDWQRVQLSIVADHGQTLLVQSLVRHELLEGLAAPELFYHQIVLSQVLVHLFSVTFGWHQFFCRPLQLFVVVPVGESLGARVGWEVVEEGEQLVRPDGHYDGLRSVVVQQFEQVLLRDELVLGPCQTHHPSFVQNAAHLPLGVCLRRCQVFFLLQSDTVRPLQVAQSLRGRLF